MTDALLKGSLYREGGTGAVPDHPALLGGRCNACGYVFFPMQRYGCEKCGSSDLADHAISGKGKLLASARVHLYAGKNRQAPFTVVSVRLDDGPIVRTLLEGLDSELKPGATVTTTLAGVSDADGNPKRDLRFAVQS
jgi:uncharacterized OB-fold protein